MTKSDDVTLIIYTDIDRPINRVMESNKPEYLGYDSRYVIAKLFKKEWKAEEQGKISTIDEYFRIKESV